MQVSIANSTSVKAGKRNVSAIAARPTSAVKPTVQHGAFCGCTSCNLPLSSGSNRRATKVAAGADQAKLLTRRAMGSVTKGSPLEKYTYSVPAEIGAQEVDVRVTHNGLCHSDLHMAYDDWGISKFPFVPGHEVVGEVVAVGSNVKNLKVGDVVGAGWIRDSCRRCLACLSGDENVCVEGYTGTIVLGNNGGFQDVMRFPADFIFSIPATLKREHAAPLLCAGVTVFAPLKRHVNRFGMKVAIMGVGGLGHLAIQFARAMGCDVTAIDVFPDKEAEAKKLGATHFVTWESITSHKIPGGDKLDLVLNCASGKIDTGKLLSLLKPDGRLVQIGIPGGGAVMQVPLQDLVFGQKTTAGSIVGGRKDMLDMLEFAGLHGVKPMIETFPLSKVNEAIEKMKKGQVRYRVVLTEDFKDW